MAFRSNSEMFYTIKSLTEVNDMKKYKIIMAAVLCGALLAGCGKTSEKMSKLNLSEILSSFKLSDMLEGYKRNFEPSDYIAPRVPQSGQQNNNTPYGRSSAEAPNSHDRSGDPRVRPEDIYGGAPKAPPGF